LNATRRLPRFQSAALLATLPLVLSAALLPAHQSQARVKTLQHRSRRVAAWRAGEAPGPVQAPRMTPIKHVVVIYLENHSFDSILGFWCNQNPGRCPDGGMPSSVRLSNGAVVTPSVSPDVVPFVRHRTVDQQNAIDGGKMDGWEKLSGCGPQTGYACVSGYRPSQVPNLAALARRFAISDMTFSMQDSPSFFGHLYAVAASTDGFTGGNPYPPVGAVTGAGWGCDSGKVTSWAPSPGAPVRTVPSCIPDPGLRFNGVPLPNGGAFARTPVHYVPTIMDRLGAAGLSWKLYGAQCASETVAPDGLKTCAKPSTQSLGYGWAICPSFAECLYSQTAGMASGSQFITDARSGNLPAFSVVTPGNDIYSEHNGFSMTTGDNWLGQQVAAVMNGPDWPSTAIFITWDDCGCFYDQVPPGVNPDRTPRGPRVPLVIVSPYARPGYTDTRPTTFAGILAYTEQNFGLVPLGFNDSLAYSFTKVFNYRQAPLKPVRMVARPLPASAKHLHLTPALLYDPS
jgi:phospholipase C